MAPSLTNIGLYLLSSSFNLFKVYEEFEKVAPSLKMVCIYGGASYDPQVHTTIQPYIHHIHIIYTSYIHL